MDDRFSFFQAITDGDTNTVISILSQTGNRAFYTHSYDHQRRSPLDIALESVINLDIIQHLLDAGVSISFDNIMFAARLHHSPEILRMLCRKQGHPNKANSNGWNPLQYAISISCRLPVIKALLDYGADPNMSRPATALQTAVMFKREPDIFRALILAGVDPNARDFNGNTAIHQAYKGGCTKSTIKCIAGIGGDANLHDSEGYTILMYAIQRNKSSFIRCLVNDLRVDCNIADTGCNRSALHFYARWRENLNIFNLAPSMLSRAWDQSIFAILVRAGADVNAIDFVGRTPLYYAAKEGNKQVIEALLKAGADPNLSDANRHFPLHIAVSMQENEIIEMLLRAGADVNAPDVEGRSPLQLAVRMNEAYATVNILIQRHNCNLDASDNHGRTALHEAAIKGDCHHILLLTRALANPNIQDENGMTPLHHAVLPPKDFSSSMFLASMTETKIKDNSGRTALHSVFLRNAPVDVTIFFCSTVS